MHYTVVPTLDGDVFVNGDISMHNNVFLNSFHQSVSESDWLTVHTSRQVVNIREGSSVLLSSDGSTIVALGVGQFSLISSD